MSKEAAASKAPASERVRKQAVVWQGRMLWASDTWTFYTVFYFPVWNSKFHSLKTNRGNRWSMSSFWSRLIGLGADYKVFPLGKPTGSPFWSVRFSTCVSALEPKHLQNAADSSRGLGLWVERLDEELPLPPFSFLLYYFPLCFDANL